MASRTVAASNTRRHASRCVVGNSTTNHATKPGVMIKIVFFKQKTAYEIKECDWSADVCSSDLPMRAAKNTFRSIPGNCVQLVYCGQKCWKIGRASCRERV